MFKIMFIKLIQLSNKLWAGKHNLHSIRATQIVHKSGIYVVDVSGSSPFSPCRPADIRLYIVRLAFSSVSDERQIPTCICTPFMSQPVLDSMLPLRNLLRISNTTLLTGCRMYLSILSLSTRLKKPRSISQHSTIVSICWSYAYDWFYCCCIPCHT